ncbi:MAG: N,N-dimethylformamidase beta subunit family domain-containing protein [Pseudomonadota bacterium]
MDTVDPDNLDIAAEFKARPFGPHSPALDKTLKLMRWAPATERYLAVQLDYGGEYFLARANGPKNHSLTIYTSVAYASAESAQWIIFRKRWEAATGVALQLPGSAPEPDPTEGDSIHSEAVAKRALLGYADEFSVAPNETIEFKVSSTLASPFHAELVRIRSADAQLVGLKQDTVASSMSGDYPSREQTIQAGSFMRVPGMPALTSLGLVAFIWPTRVGNGWQVVMGDWVEDANRGYALGITDDGCLSFRWGDGERQGSLAIDEPLLERHWYLVVASFDSNDPGNVDSARAREHRVRIAQHRLGRSYANQSDVRLADARSSIAMQGGDELTVAAARATGGRVTAHYNGKVERPRLIDRPFTDREWQGLVDDATVPAVDALSWLGAWDFHLDMASAIAVDRSEHQRHGELVNWPTRAMKGAQWDASEYNYAMKPEHYGAVHFHDDDIHDCGWTTDFAWTVPSDLRSGLYAAYLTGPERAVDWIPFVVRPRLGEPQAPLALVLPSASYWAYANRHTVIDFPAREHVRGSFATVDPTGLYLHHHPELGLSMYDDHSDGSGVCYSSRLRPILSLRPGEALWQLPADTHIIDWLDAKGIAYDIITEDDIERDGAARLMDYRCVMTGTHPEYPSLGVLDAIAEFQDRGGRFVYFGGNGFYWRVSYHPDEPGLMEMRRAEDGIRAWMSEGGEYYHAFTGELGGMWRRMGRAPQSVAGTGMTAQGFDRSTYFLCTEQANDPRARFIFNDVDTTERIGDFGIIGGGAAGWEVDRADVSLGTPPHALVVASATNFSGAYHWMKEELHHTHSAITGETCPLVRADMIFYETPGGGAVFSTSSIAWAGALSHNHYNNNVSQISENVLRRFVDPTPFTT